MKFGKQLLLQSHSAWQRHYIRYKMLKQTLKDPDLRLEAWTELLTNELIRIGAFRDKKIAAIDEILLTTASALEKNSGRSKRATTKKLTPYEKVMQISESNAALKSFGSLNETAFTKIWKKYLKKLPGRLAARGMDADSIAAEVAITEDARERFLKEVTKVLVTTSGTRIDEQQSILTAMVLKLPKPSIERRPKESKPAHAWEPKKLYNSLHIESFPPGQITRGDLAIGMFNHGGKPVQLPFICARGPFEGPVLCITAAVHGNELNGIPIIHRLMYNLDVSTLCGSVICFPVVNVAGYARNQREWSDGVDINRVFPGKKNGNSSSQFAFFFLKAIVSKIDFLLDIHTASFGRANSLYVRSDMNDPVCNRLACLLRPEIIVHSTGPCTGLRDSVMSHGKKAIVIEIADAQQFHERYLRTCLQGFERIMCYLKMLPTSELDVSPTEVALISKMPLLDRRKGKFRFRNVSSRTNLDAMAEELAGLDTSDGDLLPVSKHVPKKKRGIIPGDDMSYGIWDDDEEEDEDEEEDKPPVVCSKSYWLFTDMGGVLLVKPAVCEWVEQGQTIAEVRNLYGELIQRYVAPESGIVVGKSTNPACQSGDRILHLGILGSEFPGAVYDGH